MWCLSAYVFFGAIVSTIQLILVLVMFVDADGIVDRIEAYDLKDGETWITRCHLWLLYLWEGYLHCSVALQLRA